MLLTEPTGLREAFVVAVGAVKYGQWTPSVLALLPAATAWTPLASFPRRIDGARASVVGGMLRITGGFKDFHRSEVTHEENIWSAMMNFQI